MGGWDSSKHPRDPGGEGGGQFVSLAVIAEAIAPAGWTPAGKGAYAMSSKRRQNTIDRAKRRIGDPANLGKRRHTVNNDEEIQMWQGLIDGAKARRDKWQQVLDSGRHEDGRPLLNVETIEGDRWYYSRDGIEGLVAQEQETVDRLTRRQSEWRAYLIATRPAIAGEGVWEPDRMRDGGPNAETLDKVKAIRDAGQAVRTAVERTMADNPDVRRLVQIEAERHQAAVARRDAMESFRDRQQQEENRLLAEMGFASRFDLLVQGTAEQKQQVVEQRKDLDAQPEPEAARQALERVRQLTEEKTAVRGRVAAARSDVVLTMLKGHRSMGGELPVDNADMLPEDETTAMSYASRFYPSAWVQRMTPVDVGWADRGYYRASPAGGIADLVLSGKEDLRPMEGRPRYGRVAVHEVGHAMEEAVPGLKAAEWAFYWSRTAKGRPGTRKRPDAVQLQGYPSGEMARKDDFVDAYTGKEYGQSPESSWELFTTGMESVFAGSPYVDGDPDLEAFVLGVLATL